jgi:hypothetical protein
MTAKIDSSTLCRSRQLGISMLELVVVLTLALGLLKLSIPNIRHFIIHSANKTALSTYETIKQSLPHGSQLSRPAIMFSQTQTNELSYAPLASVSIPKQVRLNYFINLPRRDAPSILTFEVEPIGGTQFYRYIAVDNQIIEQVVKKEL